MFKLAVVALLGMVVVAAAVDVEIQKKHYKEKDEDYKEYEKDSKVVYKPYYPSKANVYTVHKEWDLTEEVKSRHPCDKQYEILGSTVSLSAELFDDKAKNVGSVFWSGIVTHHDTCGHCKDYKAKTEHIVNVNYQVTFEFTEEHKGQIVCGVAADSIFSEETVKCAVLGGTGAFDGVWGTITWTFGKPSQYAFDIYFPKIVEVKDYKDKDSKDEKYDDKY